MSKEHPCTKRGTGARPCGLGIPPPSSTYGKNDWQGDRQNSNIFATTWLAAVTRGCYHGHWNGNLLASLKWEFVDNWTLCLIVILTMSFAYKWSSNSTIRFPQCQWWPSVPTVSIVIWFAYKYGWKIVHLKYIRGLSQNALWVPEFDKLWQNTKVVRLMGILITASGDHCLCPVEPIAIDI